MNLSAYTYSFPFKNAFSTSSTSFTNREGIILTLRDGEQIAFGEAAPLPGFSAESLANVIEQLQRHSSVITELFEKLSKLSTIADFQRQYTILPSLSFALDTLAIHHLSRCKGVADSSLLFNRKTNPPAVNGIIALKETQKAIKQTEKLVEKGYSTVKLKVGRNFEKDFNILCEIRQRFPGIKLRIDANRAWDINAAQHNLSKFDQLNLEYCEEPLAEPTSQDLQKLASSVRTPIALDESLLSETNLESFAEVISVMIIKPMLFGGLSKIFATKRLANHHDNKVVFTSSLESGIGRRMTALLASGLGSDTAHGLSTGELLDMDVWQDGTYINKGFFSLPAFEKLEKNFTRNRKKLDLKQINL